MIVVVFIVCRMSVIEVCEKRNLIVVRILVERCGTILAIGLFVVTDYFHLFFCFGIVNISDAVEPHLYKREVSFESVFISVQLAS